MDERGHQGPYGTTIVNGSEPVLDDKRLKQIGYQLELKCRDVEF